MDFESRPPRPADLCEPRVTSRFRPNLAVGGGVLPSGLEDFNAQNLAPRASQGYFLEKNWRTAFLREALSRTGVRSDIHSAGSASQPNEGTGAKADDVAHTEADQAEDWDMWRTAAAAMHPITLRLSNDEHERT